MSSRFWTILILATALAVPRVVCAQEGGGVLLKQWGDVKWRTDYHAARKEAVEKNLPLLIDFGTVACTWCKRLDETTFRDPRVVSLMNERFVPLKIDAERDPSLADYLRITEYPTIVFATSTGVIHEKIGGYKDANSFHEILQTVSANLHAPEWMRRDLQLASQKMQKGEYAAAITTLRGILDDPKGRPLHPHAQKFLDAIEGKAMERVTQARDMQDKGRGAEAIDHLADTVRFFPGLEASRQATDLMARLKEQSDMERSAALRTQRARQLLAQAREFYKQRDLVPCLERCSALTREFVDLPEGQDGMLLMAELKANPVLLQQAADSLSDRLGEVYLALAESHLQKGQPQRAEYFFQRVVLACPGTRHAESAQVRLVQLQGIRPRNGQGTATAGNPE